MGIAGDILGFLGGGLDAKERRSQQQHSEDLARDAANRNEALQREFAQSGIQWRVEDAKKAGLHPVFALSGGGAAYAPSAVSVGNNVGDDMSRMGQGLGRAIDSVMSGEDKTVKSLQQALLRSQIAKTDAEASAIRAGTNRGGPGQVGPGIPSPSSAVTHPDFESVTPDVVVSADSTDRSLTASEMRPALSRYIMKDADGNDTTLYLPSKDMSEPLESLSENYGLLYAFVMENLKRDPNLIYKMRHLWPGGELVGDLARALERASQYYLNQRKGRAAAQDMADRTWNRSGRERGIDWRTGR